MPDPVTATPGPRTPPAYHSASAVRTMRQCPRAYWYQYRDPECPKPLPTPADAAMARGTLFHAGMAAIGASVRDGGPAPAAEVAATFLREPDGPAEAGVWQEARALLRAVAPRVPWRGVKLIEHFWRMPIDDGTMHVDGEMGGFIDRVDTGENGAVDAWDYKTGNPFHGGAARFAAADKREELLADPQPLFYLAWLRREFPGAPHVHIHFWWVEPDLTVSLAWDPDLDALARWTAAGHARAIAAAGDDVARWAPAPGSQCPGCPWRGICPAADAALEQAGEIQPPERSDLVALVTARQRLKMIAELAEARRKDVDARLSAWLRGLPPASRNQEIAGWRVRLAARSTTDWPDAGEAVATVARVLGLPEKTVGEKILRVSPGAVTDLLRGVADTAARERARDEIEAVALRDVSAHVEIRSAGPRGKLFV